MPWLLLAAGLAALVLGAELLVRAAAALARRFNVPPLLIGLTIVSFGTSAPEIAVSLNAVHTGRPGLALGNVVGSNTFNVLFILGLSALVRPLLVHVKLVRVDVPIMIGASAALWLMLLDGSLSRFDAALLTAGIIAYTALAVRLARREPGAEEPDPQEPRRANSVLATLTLLAFGLALTVLGARLFVNAAVDLATTWGVSETIVGLTIVAAGTSLPEVATSLVAALRNHRDIAVGNVVGSNIFNILAILGVCGLAAPEPLPVPPALLTFDLPVMTAVAAACLPVFFTGHTIERWEGALLLAGYAAYLTYLVLQAGAHDALEGFARVTLYFALPVATLGLAASVVGSIRSRTTTRRP